jgi:hypothetical protein
MGWPTFGWFFYKLIWSPWSQPTQTYHQGDQIGRFLAHWMIVYLGQVFTYLFTVVAEIINRFFAVKALNLDKLRFGPCFHKNNLLTTYHHRNLCTRTSMFELLLQTFWAKKNLVKSLLISTLDKVIYYKGNIFTGLNKTSLHKIGWRPAEKIRPFSTCVFYVVLRFLWSPSICTCHCPQKTRNRKIFGVRKCVT